MKANGKKKRDKRKDNEIPTVDTLVPESEPKKYTFTSVVAGDMNVDGCIERNQRNEGNSALDELLTVGSVESDFTEDGIQVTNKGKMNKVGLFHDAYMHAYAP